MKFTKTKYYYTYLALYTHTLVSLIPHDKVVIGGKPKGSIPLTSGSLVEITHNDKHKFTFAITEPMAGGASKPSNVRLKALLKVVPTAVVCFSHYR